MRNARRAALAIPSSLLREIEQARRNVAGIERCKKEIFAAVAARDAAALACALISRHAPVAAALKNERGAKRV